MSLPEESEDQASRYYVGRLFFVNDDLYEVTAVGERKDGKGTIPTMVRKLEF